MLRTHSSRSSEAEGNVGVKVLVQFFKFGQCGGRDLGSDPVHFTTELESKSNQQNNFKCHSLRPDQLVRLCNPILSKLYLQHFIKQLSLFSYFCLSVVKFSFRRNRFNLWPGKKNKWQEEFIFCKSACLGFFFFLSRCHFIKIQNPLPENPISRRWITSLPCRMPLGKIN